MAEQFEQDIDTPQLHGHHLWALIQQDSHRLQAEQAQLNHIERMRQRLAEPDKHLAQQHIQLYKSEIERDTAETNPQLRKYRLQILSRRLNQDIRQLRERSPYSHLSSSEKFSIFEQMNDMAKNLNSIIETL
jgi:hypothetical protein